MNLPEGIPAPIMTSSTEVLLPGSETPVKVTVGQLDEGVQTLSKAEFQKASEIQKARDRAMEAKEKESGGNSQQPQTAPSPQPESVAPPSGKPSPARQTTSVPKSVARKPKPKAVVKDPRFDKLASRITEMEESQALVARGMDKVIEMLAARDLRESAAQDPSLTPNQPPTFPHGLQYASAALQTAGGEEEEVTDAAPRRTEDFGELSITEELTDEFDDTNTVMGGAEDAETPESVVPDRGAVESDSFEPGDPDIARLQAHIARKNPLKDFRRFWATISARAGFTEWPKEMQEKFTESFNSTVRHPKLLYQVRRCMLKMRNGKCIGEEQMYRIVLMLAGHCVLYSIITQED